MTKINSLHWKIIGQNSFKKSMTEQCMCVFVNALIIGRNNIIFGSSDECKQIIFLDIFSNLYVIKQSPVTWWQSHVLLRILSSVPYIYNRKKLNFSKKLMNTYIIYKTYISYIRNTYIYIYIVLYFLSEFISSPEFFPWFLEKERDPRISG